MTCVLVAISARLRRAHLQRQITNDIDNVVASARRCGVIMKRPND